MPHRERGVSGTLRDWVAMDKVGRMEMALRYGCNPHQTPHACSCQGTRHRSASSTAGLGTSTCSMRWAWQLVHELRQATGLPSAASFKHTSPAGAAVARPLTETFRQAYLLPDMELSPVATAYARARGGDRVSSYGDAVAVSDRVDLSLAKLLQREVSDLIIAPDYDPEALALLQAKKNGGYLILQIDPAYVPPEWKAATFLA